MGKDELSGGHDGYSRVTIYTDGACIGNPGPGGWGAVLLWNGAEHRMQGGDKATTNNRMELMAAIQALELLKRPCEVELYSDSAYLVHAFTQRWLDKWQRNGWRNSKNEPVENRELWLRLLEMDGIHRISWRKVKGHSGDLYNSLCDAMAQDEALTQFSGLGSDR